MTGKPFRTKRLLLRPARLDDLHPLHAIFSDPRAMRYWDRPAYEDIALTRDFLEHFIHRDWDAREEFILDLDGLCIGKAGCWRRAELGYILHPDYWRRGLMTEALTALIPRCFAKFPEEPALTAECDPRNTASAKLLEKLGFQRTSYETRNFQYGDEWCDTAYYALPRP
ncbi:MAG: GNAT family N-acetyltransferase [Paracoccaceae bacterium]|nr:GNAT family N-acetyltransferase [Paracoccaceae bacterium]